MKRSMLWYSRMFSSRSGYGLLDDGDINLLDLDSLASCNGVLDSECQVHCYHGNDTEGNLLRIRYWICRPGCTLAAVITQAFNLYCLESWSWRYSHVWTSTVICISVTVAMYAVLQFYVTMKVELAPYQPMLKFFAVKAVVFLTFWGECMLVVLASVGVIKGNRYWSAHEIQVGISAVLSCFVMMIFGFLHVKSFTYLPYRGDSLDPKERKFNKTKMLPALSNVLDFRDVGRDLWTGTKQIGRLCAGKKVEESFVQEVDHLDNALGRSRFIKKKEGEDGDATKALMKEKTDIEQELERVKLALNDDPDEAFVSEVPPMTERLQSTANSPWENTTTAYTPLFNLTRTTSPAPSSAIGIAPTSSLRSGPAEAISFGDTRRFPKSSTGLLYPKTPPELNNDQHSVKFPERLEGDAGEAVYDKPTSWFRRVFRRSGSGATDSRAIHTPLHQGPTSRNDAVIDEILEDRSVSYDYPAAPLSQQARPYTGRSGAVTHHMREYVTTRTGRDQAHALSPPRDGLIMPNPLSPSRYPGFNEQAHVDRMYALHAVAMNVVSPPPDTQLPTQPLSNSLSTATYHSQVSPQPVMDERVSAAYAQPCHIVRHSMNSIGESASRLPRHDLPPAGPSVNAILPSKLSSPSGRRPLPTPPVRQAETNGQELYPSNPSVRPSSANDQTYTPASSLSSLHAASSRHGPVQRLGLGLSYPDEQPRHTPAEAGQRGTRFVYDEY